MIVADHHARLGTRLLAKLCRGRHLRQLDFTCFQGATRTDPGVRFSRTGLFVNTRFRSKARAMLSPCSLSPTVRFALLSGPSCPGSVSFVGFVPRQPLPLMNGSPAL